MLVMLTKQCFVNRAIESNIEQHRLHHEPLHTIFVSNNTCFNRPICIFSSCALSVLVAALRFQPLLLSSLDILSINCFRSSSMRKATHKVFSSASFCFNASSSCVYTWPV